MQSKQSTFAAFSEFSILPYTQNRKLGLLGKFFFAPSFYRSCNIDANTTKSLMRQKLKDQDMF